MGIVVSFPLAVRAMDGVSDAEMVGRAVEGDRRAREILYRRHASSLLAMTTRLLRNRSEAEEVVQDTFVTGFEQLAALREPAAFRAWLGQIAVSLVRRRIRRGRLFRLFGFEPGAEDATLAALAAPGMAADQRAELSLVDRLLGDMRGDVRVAWMLRRVEGLELTEVAALCDCSLATIKRRIAEADAVIRRHVGDGEMEDAS
jgi:RNA polymerase sigma-70 factor (ECF subfamily)